MVTCKYGGHFNESSSLFTKHLQTFLSALKYEREPHHKRLSSSTLLRMQPKWLSWINLTLWC